MKHINDRVRIAVGVIYCIFFIYVLFFAYFRSDTSTAVNLNSFETISRSIKVMFNPIASARYKFFIMGGLIGNVLLLFPLPIIFKLNWKWTRIIIFSLLLPAAIETLQYFFEVGAADIDDIILNSFGCAAGFWIHKKSL